MADARRSLTAADLDAMTPDQRAAAFNERIVTDLAELPEDVREKVTDTAHRLAVQLDHPRTNRPQPMDPIRATRSAQNATQPRIRVTGL